jgi:hypothetical protein
VPYCCLPSRSPRVFSPTLRFVAAIFLLSAVPAVASISGRADGHHLRIAGASPSGEVIVVSAIRETKRGRAISLDRVSQALTADGAGSADLDYGQDIPIASIWAVVDQISGSYAIVTPGDYPRRQKASVGSILKHATPAEVIDQLVTNSLVMQILWVRPGNGGGSWNVTVSDGAANDEDHSSNGEVLTSTELFTSIDGKNKPPKKLKKDDVLILIDPFEMTFVSTVVPR